MSEAIDNIVIDSVIGIDEDLNVFGGYDDVIVEAHTTSEHRFDDEAGRLSASERRELADRMIALAAVQRRYARSVIPEGSVADPHAPETTKPAKAGFVRSRPRRGVWGCIDLASQPGMSTEPFVLPGLRRRERRLDDDGGLAGGHSLAPLPLPGPTAFRLIFGHKSQSTF